MCECSLLIGNGFNRLEDPHFPNWDDLIKTPVKEKSGFVDIQNMSYPLKFEYIVNFCNANEQAFSSSTYAEIKKAISDRLNESINRSDKRIDKDIATLLKVISPNNILTTNYDSLLEKVFISRKSKAEYSNRFRKNNEDREYFLNSTRCLGPEDHKTSFYHVHGIDSIPRSICLGYEHYMRIVNALRNRIIGNSSKSIRIIEYLKNKNKFGRSIVK